MIFTEKDRARFESKYIPEPNSGCWLWDAAINHAGYGLATVGRRTVRAHRASYEMHVSPIPEGMHVLHRCDVRGCVNPAHLFLGTHTDNMIDMARKGRSGSPIGDEHYSRTNPERLARGDSHGSRTKPGNTLRGERCPAAKLTEAAALHIRSQYAAGQTQQEIADEHGISRGAVSNVIRGRTWGFGGRVVPRRRNKRCAA